MHNKTTAVWQVKRSWATSLKTYKKKIPNAEGLSLEMTRAFLHKIGAGDSDACPCGAAQTIEHIINSCTLYGAPYGTADLVDLDTDSVAWLNTDIPVWYVWFHTNKWTRNVSFSSNKFWQLPDSFGF